MLIFLLDIIGIALPIVAILPFLFKKGAMRKATTAYCDGGLSKLEPFVKSSIVAFEGFCFQLLSKIFQVFDSSSLGWGPCQERVLVIMAVLAWIAYDYGSERLIARESNAQEEKNTNISSLS